MYELKVSIIMLVNLTSKLSVNIDGTTKIHNIERCCCVQLNVHWHRQG